MPQSQPSPLPAPPRMLRLRRGARWRIWLPRIVTLVMLCAGLFLVWIIVSYPVTRLLGSDLPIRVESVTPDLRSGPPGDVFVVAFSYDDGHGARQFGRGRIDTDGASPPSVGEQIVARKLAFNPLNTVALARQHINTPILLAMALFAVVWCGVVGMGAAIAWLVPIFDRRRVRDGVAVPGRITAKTQSKRGRKSHFEIAYEYRAPDGEFHQGTQAVGSEVFERLQKGQTITVLFRELAPEFSSIYEASAYEVQNSSHALPLDVPVKNARE